VISYAHEWRLADAERVLHRAAERLGSRTPEIMHYLACVSFARRDFAAAQEYFRHALEAAPNDTSLIRNWQAAQAAGTTNYQKQGQVAQRLFANLRSTEFLYLPDGTRQLTMAPTSAGD
jgi:Flp pilus assembly protein TadD